MSELYLTLRRRLDEVNSWIEIGVDTMRTARNAKGLSYEAMGRLLNVSSKTYERHEKAGRLPRQLVEKFATILDLEIDTPTPVRITVPADPSLSSDVRELRVQIERLVDRLDRQAEAQERGGKTQETVEAP